MCLINVKYNYLFIDSLKCQLANFAISEDENDDENDDKDDDDEYKDD